MCHVLFKEIELFEFGVHSNAASMNLFQIDQLFSQLPPLMLIAGVVWNS